MPTGAAIDIIGLTPGMTLAEAEAIINAHLPGRRRLTFGLKNKSSLPTPFAQGFAYIKPDNSEYIVLNHEPALAKDRVLAIGRFVYAGRASINREDLIKDLQDKYDIALQPNTQELVYQRAELLKAGAPAECLTQIGSIAGSVTFSEDGRMIDPASITHEELRGQFQGVESMPWLGFNSAYLQTPDAYKRCKPSVTAWVPTTPDGAPAIGGFVVWSVDPKLYIETLFADQSKGRPRPKL